MIGEKLWRSDETYRIFGFTPGDQAAFSKFVDTIHPEDQPVVKELIERSIKHGTPLKLDYRIELPGGEVRFLHE